MSIAQARSCRNRQRTVRRRPAGLQRCLYGCRCLRLAVLRRVCGCRAIHRGVGVVRARP